MGMPGGNRRENRNGAPGRHLRDTETLACDEFKGRAGIANIRALTPHVGEGEEGIAGIWLATADGTKLFCTATSATGEPQGPSLEPVSEEEADQATLDAASWLMPHLPRELIAEVLQLGKCRRNGGVP